MDIPVTEAQARLSELVRQAAEGEDVFLTERGQRVARLVAERESTDEARKAALRNFQEAASKAITDGPSAARSQDFLYDEWGVPK